MSGAKKKEPREFIPKKRGKRVNPYPVLLGHVFKKGLKAPGLKRLGDILELTKDWHGIVGPHFARKLLPVTLSNGVLSVATPHPAWSSEAQNYVKFFIKNIQERFPAGPKVRSFRFFYAPHLFNQENSSPVGQLSLGTHSHSPSLGSDPPYPHGAQNASQGLQGALDRLAQAVEKNKMDRNNRR